MRGDNVALYICLFLFIIWTAFKQMLSARSPENINGFKTALCITVSLMMMSFADNLARSTVVMVYFLVVSGYLIGSSHENPASA